MEDLWLALIIKRLSAPYRLKKEHCEHTFLGQKETQSLFLVNVYYFHIITKWENYPKFTIDYTSPQIQKYIKIAHHDYVEFIPGM